jgi:histidyl-tRNA synthetase
VYVAYAQEDLRQRAITVASALRAKGIPAEFDIAGRSLKKQLEEASKREYASTAIIAPEEMAKNQLIIRDMKKGSENKVKFDEFLSNPASALQ